MAQAPETFVVRFSNRYAIQCLQEAKELVAEESVETPWSDNLRRAKECLDEAWDGLTFAESKE